MMSIQAVSELQMGQWVIVFFAVAAGVASIVKIITAFKSQPPLHEQFAGKAETNSRLDDLEAKVEKIREESHEQYINLLRAGEERAGKIHSRMESHAQLVEAQLRDLTAQVHRIAGVIEKR
jgi:hypothetical protein